MPRTFHVFHQNMMVFGGAAAARNQIFVNAFNGVGLGTATDYVLAAGFTEIKNAGVAPAALNGMVVALDPGLEAGNVVVVGISASRVLEYIVMAAFHGDARNRFNVTGYGKVVRTSDGPRWTCFAAPGDLPANALPANMIADSRGIAYLVGTIVSAADKRWDGKTVVVAFMHNMYGTGDRYGGMAQLPNALKAICDRHGLPYTTAFVLGGDFNVDPRAVPDRSGNFPLAADFAVDAAGNMVPTTLGNTYDFFFAKEGFGAGVTVWTQTRGKGTGLSDHAGVSIRLDANGL